MFHMCLFQAISDGIDIRKEFIGLDSNSAGWLNRETFIQVLDNLNLSKHLNDQELLTVVRRFREGEKYHYLELADLFSHVYFHDSVKNHRSQLPYDITDINSFIITARFRSTQWRRYYKIQIIFNFPI